MQSGWRLIITLIFLATTIAFSGCAKNRFTAEVLPKGETDRESSIRVTFSQPVLKDNKWAVIKVPFTEHFFEITPATAGEYEWESENVLQFTPYERLTADTKYKVVLPEMVAGRKLKGKRVFEFHTPPFKLENAHMYFDFYIFDVGQKNVLIDLAFNYDVNPEDIKRFVRLERNGTDFPFEVVTSEDRSKYRLISDPIGKERKTQKFDLIVDKDLPNMESGTSLEKGRTESLRLDKIPDFKYLGVKAEKRGRENIVRLRFNKILDPGFVKNYIKVEDITEKASERVTFQVKVDTALVTLSGPFKYERRYQIIVAEGLKATDGTSLEKEVKENVNIPKPEKSIRFMQPGQLLPVKDDVNIFVESYDVPKLSLQAYRVPEVNIPFVANNKDRQGFGEVVYNQDYEVKLDDPFAFNVTEINLQSFIKKYGKGLYRFQIRAANGWPRADKWVLGTDMGLVLKNDSQNMTVFCGSLTGFSPLAGVEVSLLNRQGETLQKAVTDQEGFVVFKDYTEAFKKEYLPTLVLAKKNDDTAYLLLDETKVNLTTFDISGDRYRVGALEAFVYPARNLYKPGEEIQLAAVVKKIGGEKLKDLPARMRVTDPLSRLVFDETVALNQVGMCGFRFSLPAGANTGLYQAVLSLGNELSLGQTTFQVEEFIPQSLKVEIDVDTQLIRPGKPLQYHVLAKNLFGSAASGRRVASNVEFSYKSFKPRGYEEFSFVNNRFSFQTQKETLGETELDDQGLVSFDVNVPAKPIPHGLLNARLYAEVQQKGGRAVAMMKNVEIADKPYFLGVRKIQQAFSNLEKPSRFEIVALDRLGKPVSVKNVEIFIIKQGWYNIYQKSAWKQEGSYNSEEYQDIVLRKHIPVLKGKTLFTYQHETLGSYEIVVIHKDDNVSANLGYYVAGAGDVDMPLEKAEELKLQWSRDAYKIGETAELSINAPMKGLLMLTIERDKVLYRKFMLLNERASVVKIPVQEDFLPNAYVVGMLFKTYQDYDSTLPLKAYGALPLKIDQDSRRLKLEINVPDSINPNSNVEVEVKSNYASEQAFVTLSVVEEGALDITDFHVPQIYDFFMRKRALTVESYDTFAQVMGELPQLKGELTIGGGEYEPSEKHLNPIQFKKKKTVAYWSGVVAMSNGRAAFKVPVGSYNGSLRFMAVAASDDRYGSKEISKSIFSPIILQPTVPLTIGPEDKLQIPISVFNKTGLAQTITLTAQTEGPLFIRGTAEQALELANDEEAFVSYRVEAQKKIGVAAVVFTARANGLTLSCREDLAIRPASAKETITRQGILKTGKTVRLRQETEYFLETQKGSLFVSPFPEAEHLRHLEYLNSYPYGCLEQRVSMAFPQLYVPTILKVAAPFLQSPEREKKILKAVIQETELQYRPGGFELWNGYQGSLYLTIYVTEFLTEAEKAGYEINEKVLKGALDDLENLVRGALNEDLSDQSLMNVTYALYVLANGKRNQRESMEFVRQKILKDDSSILSWIALAAAYAKTGDVPTAKAILAKKKDIVFPENFTWWGNPYLTDTSAMALLASTLLDIDPNHPSLAMCLEDLTQKVRQQRMLNTHESARVLAVYAKLFSANQIRALNGVVRLVGLEEPVTGTYYKKDLANVPYFDVALENKNQESLYYTFYAEAYPKREDYNRPLDEDIRVDRTLYDSTGQPLDVKNIKQGELVVQKLDVEANASGNVVIVALFPGGLEIENPRLKNAEGMEWIPDYENDSSDYINIRDDRLIIYTDFRNEGGSRQYYFSFRAVFPGEFTLPYVMAEDMYHLERRGRSISQKIFIVPRD